MEIKPQNAIDALSDWMNDNLDIAGRYIGAPLQEHGFPYDALEYVPAGDRIAAMELHHKAHEEAVESLLRL